MNCLLLLLLAYRVVWPLDSNEVMEVDGILLSLVIAQQLLHVSAQGVQWTATHLHWTLRQQAKS